MINTCLEGVISIAFYIGIHENTHTRTHTHTHTNTRTQDMSRLTEIIAVSQPVYLLSCIVYIIQLYIPFISEEMDTSSIICAEQK